MYAYDFIEISSKGLCLLQPNIIAYFDKIQASLVSLCTTGVRITTRQLAKCEYILASKNTNPLVSLARFFFSLTISTFLASCFLTWRVKILNYSPNCLEKLFHTPVYKPEITHQITRHRSRRANIKAS
jgi:hypothetical protein